MALKLELITVRVQLMVNCALKSGFTCVRWPRLTELPVPHHQVIKFTYAKSS